MQTAHCKNNICASFFIVSYDGMDDFFTTVKKKNIWERFQTVEKLNKDLGAFGHVPPPSPVPGDMSVMLLKL